MRSTELSIDHPDHSLPDDVREALGAIRSLELAEFARRDELAKLARPTSAERKRLAETAAKAPGMTAEMRKTRLDINKKRFDRISKHLKAAADEAVSERYHIPVNPISVPEVDHTFWWARTEWYFPTDGTTVSSRNDGLHFFGGITHHTGALRTDRFGAIAYFELQKSRIPHSPTGLWYSAPYVELFGGLLGYTGDSDIATGDLWSKCWMHRDQQIYQFTFGMDGPAPIPLGQAHEVETLIFEENAARHVRVNLRGHQPMPPVMFSGINFANSSVWARLEIQFDIQVEGAGTLIWADPEVLLRTYQWPLNVIS